MDPKGRARQEAARLERKYGLKAASVGSERFQLDVIPTGSLALDYALGTGGWPRGHCVEVFGPPDIGKSSAVGLAAIRSAQEMDLLCGIVGLEPGFDPDWAEKNGVDPDRLVVGRPDDGEQAFEMLHEWIRGDVIDFVLFDSIGAVLRPSEVREGGKPSQGGQSNLITWGVKNAVMPVWKNNKGLMYLNQIRDDMKSPIPGQYESPGGHALKHCCPIRVQLRQGGRPFKARIEGEEEVIGRTINATVKRNKLSEGSMRRAEFDYYLKDTDEFRVGIDIGKDVIATGMRTRVIEHAGAWYRHPTFPGDKHQLQGKDSVGEYLLSNSRALDTIRLEILEVMLRNQGAVKSVKPDLEVIENA